MALFGFGKKKKIGNKQLPSFTYAENTLGVKSEAELKERAKILLNDTDGILQTDIMDNAKMDSYLNSTAFEDLDFTSVARPSTNALIFEGYRNETNNITFCYDLNEINFRAINALPPGTSAFSVKLIFFPTENTPHFVGKIAINDGTVNSINTISPMSADVNFNFAHLAMRIRVYELIVFPETSINFIDSKYIGQERYEVRTFRFENSFNVRTTFLREAEAYMKSLGSFSVFSHEGMAVAPVYQKCFDMFGNAVSEDAKKYYTIRLKYAPKPSIPDDWTKFSV